MKPARFENDLKNLASDIASTLNMKKRSEEVQESLVECMIGLRSFNKKVENLIATGELLEQFLLSIEEDLCNVFQKSNTSTHNHIIEQIISVFTQYGTLDYKSNVTEQANKIPVTAWKTAHFNLPAEPLVALVLSSYVLAVQAEKNKTITKKALKLLIAKLFLVSNKLCALKSSLES